MITSKPGAEGVAEAITAARVEVVHDWTVGATMTPAEQFQQIVHGKLGHAQSEPPAPPQPRAPEPNPMQGMGATGTPIPDPDAGARAFVEALQTYAATGPHGVWHDLLTQARTRGH